MSDFTRRELLRMAALAPLAAGFTWAFSDVAKARHRVDRAAAFSPAFFTEHEYETVRVLVDLIIPADERSGSATDAAVPEFMDFMMIDRPAMQTPMRGGLAWMDHASIEMHGHAFLASSDAERRTLLDAIAYSDAAPPELSHGVAFFASFRDLTASGFWSSLLGVEDLQYIGNVFVPEWTGCPPEALERVGVRYDE